MASVVGRSMRSSNKRGRAQDEEEKASSVAQVSPYASAVSSSSSSHDEGNPRQKKTKTKLQIFPRRKAGQRQREQQTGTAVVLTLDVLKSLANIPLVGAAKKLGISKTSLKTASRSLGLPRWPFRRQGQGEGSTMAASDSNTNKDSGTDSGESSASSKSTVVAHRPKEEDGASEKPREAEKIAPKDGDHNDLSWMSLDAESRSPSPAEEEEHAAKRESTPVPSTVSDREVEWDSDPVDPYPLHIRIPNGTMPQLVQDGVENSRLALIKSMLALYNERDRDGPEPRSQARAPPN